MEVRLVYYWKFPIAAFILGAFEWIPKQSYTNTGYHIGAVDWKELCTNFITFIMASAALPAYAPFDTDAELSSLPQKWDEWIQGL